ncbi:MAG: hypothetical protein HDT41_04860 [Lachnospiraceae bacterium]|nr:hypothetical protein [Lachnospiraceae bacterium]
MYFSNISSYYNVIMPVLTIIVYQDNFGTRFETAEWIAYSVNDFEGLKVEECVFPSNDGQLLACWQCVELPSGCKAAVLVAGFDRSTDLFEQQGESMNGSGIKLFMPYVSL